jgi:catechol 2,3-dioxygenase-like lactoylglutathione lyase family enzyme
MTVKAIDHVYYWTKDMQAAIDFYRDVLGLELLRRSEDAWAEFDAGPIRFALHGGADGASPSGGTVVFEVDDLDRARPDLAAKGVAFEQEAGEVPGVARFASFRDPDGNIVQIIEYLPHPS